MTFNFPLIKALCKFCVENKTIRRQELEHRDQIGVMTLDYQVIGASDWINV